MENVFQPRRRENSSKEAAEGKQQAWAKFNDKSSAAGHRN